MRRQRLALPSGYGKSRWVIILLLAVSAWFFGHRISMSSLAPIHYVRVEGELNHIDPDEVTQGLEAKLNGGYFGTDLGAVEQGVKRCGWVDRVEASRVWPDALILKIVEQRPVALWGGEGYLNSRGELFKPHSVDTHPDLPRLFGSPGQEKRLLLTLMRLNQGWRNRGVRVARLDLSERSAWSAEMDNGLKVVFGRQDPVLATERLQKLLPRLGERKFAELHSIDVRYANGMALTWRKLTDIAAPDNPGAAPESGEFSR